jgi:hypothetical protein
MIYPLNHSSYLKATRSDKFVRNELAQLKVASGEGQDFMSPLHIDNNVPGSCNQRLRFLKYDGRVWTLSKCYCLGRAEASA